MKHRFPLHYRDIYLRAVQVDDVERYVRWHLEETEWQKWDAPWEEMESDPDRIREKIHWIANRPAPEIWTRLQLFHADGEHIGWVSAYMIDNDPTMRAIGIGIPETSYWGQGLGQQAFTLWMAYFFTLSDVDRIYTETWSGNQRMVRLAEKCGFREIEREKNYRKVRGELVDGLRFERTREDFVREHGKLMLELGRKLQDRAISEDGN